VSQFEIFKLRHYHKCWKINGSYHEDGPAIEYSDGLNHWYLNNIEYTFEKWLEKTPI